MQALVHDPTAPSSLRRTTLPDPEPAPGEVLVAVSAAAFNFLDLAYADQVHGVGNVPGEDAAGVVLRAAADGSGPPAGSRVSSFAMGGALATLRTVSTSDVGVVPDGVGLVEAAALSCRPGCGGRLIPRSAGEVRGAGRCGGRCAARTAGRRKAVVEIGPVS